MQKGSTKDYFLNKKKKTAEQSRLRQEPRAQDQAARPLERLYRSRRRRPRRRRRRRARIGRGLAGRPERRHNRGRSPHRHERTEGRARGREAPTRPRPPPGLPRGVAAQVTSSSTTTTPFESRVRRPPRPCRPRESGSAGRWLILQRRGEQDAKGDLAGATEMLVRPRTSSRERHVRVDLSPRLQDRLAVLPRAGTARARGVLFQKIWTRERAASFTATRACRGLRGRPPATSGSPARTGRDSRRPQATPRRNAS